MTNTLRKNETYTAEITAYSTDGAGICKIDNVVCFVKGAARGDICKVKIVKTLRNTAFGIIDELITPSAYRVEPDCQYFPKCGGCDFWHISYSEELYLKKQRVTEALSRLGGFADIDVPIVPSASQTRYRNKAQYPFGIFERDIVTGFFRARSHDIVPVRECLIQKECADNIAHILCAWARLYGVSVYNEKTASGVLRHAYVRTGDGGVQLCIVATKRRLKNLDELVDMLSKACPELCSIVLNVNTTEGNTILGGKNVTLWGSPTLSDTLCGNTFDISPNSFYQINKPQAEAVYNKALEYAALTGAETVLDLYCGIGTITLHMARHAAAAYGIEVVQAAVDNARENAERAGLTNCTFNCNDAAQGAKNLAESGVKVDVLIVDPPRKGMDTPTLDIILKISSERIVYVSCDCATMARDMKYLAANGYVLKDVTAYDMFPKTANVESVGLLVRE